MSFLRGRSKEAGTPVEKSSSARVTPVETAAFRAVRPGWARLCRGTVRPVGVGGPSSARWRPASLILIERRRIGPALTFARVAGPHQSPGRPPRHAPGGSEKGR